MWLYRVCDYIKVFLYSFYIDWFFQGCDYMEEIYKMWLDRGWLYRGLTVLKKYNNICKIALENVHKSWFICTIYFI